MISLTLSLLIQANTQPSATWSSLLGPIVIFGILVAALIATALFVRKWALGGDSDGDLSNFSMAQLRKMRDRGQLSEIEYEHAKAAVIEQSRRMLEEKP